MNDMQTKIVVKGFRVIGPDPEEGSSREFGAEIDALSIKITGKHSQRDAVMAAMREAFDVVGDFSLEVLWHG